MFLQWRWALPDKLGHAHNLRPQIQIDIPGGSSGESSFGGGGGGGRSLSLTLSYRSLILAAGRGSRSLTVKQIVHRNTWTFRGQRQVELHVIHFPIAISSPGFRASAENVRNGNHNSECRRGFRHRIELVPSTETYLSTCPLGGVSKATAPADRKSTRLNSSHSGESRMPSSA